jgi:hypothetical protein
MKKRILIISIALSTLVLMAFGFMNWSDAKIERVKPLSSKVVAMEQPFAEDRNKPDLVEFFYDVDSRFRRTLTKEDLNRARSIHDILSNDMTQRVETYKSVSVIILENDKQTEIKETGKNDVLTAAQRKLLRESKYSTNFLIRAEYQQKNKETGVMEDSYFTPYITIVPEKQAEYVDGKDALLAYLKENSKEKTAIVEENKLQPGKLFFTITKKGDISNVTLGPSSGYPSIDETMLELITNAPGKWEAAENSKGEKVEQQLVFSFGLVGC